MWQKDLGSCETGNVMVMMVRAAGGEPDIPDGFPILLDAQMAIIEPAFAYLLKHAIIRGRSRSQDTVRTYGEHLYDWFDALEQSTIDWRDVNEGTIAGYRNRMLETASPHTKRPYGRVTINARVQTVCRFYAWAWEEKLIDELPYTAEQRRALRFGELQQVNRTPPVNPLTLAVAERLPRPLRVDELERLFKHLEAAPRVAAEWALTAGLRRKEICGLTLDQVPDPHALAADETPLVGVPLAITKGDRPRTVYPPVKLIDRTDWYIGEDRAAIVRRRRRVDRSYRPSRQLLLNSYGNPLTRKRLTALLAEGFAKAKLDGTLHWLRHTFAMAMLARLQRQARENPDLNPLKILQILMGHRSITTTAIYLRCVELYERDVVESLDFLYGDLIPTAG
ncbi:site-specific recombinase XerD [Hephaestia caeni]|uniref:Site-specific recombinase XerD n=1 Tax=Hephaestia caeni TaxID=645617 RepID=A0A397PL64_9SPHN|nr:tyrosine-type recombinase/integrase [Hephaestia caeni]RIA46421.1 site-specific recombinase XerD [Hephaestia caeni]